MKYNGKVLSVIFFSYLGIVFDCGFVEKCNVHYSDSLLNYLNATSFELCFKICIRQFQEFCKIESKNGH